MTPIKISAVIITFNEEKNIKRCINSLRGVADEIVVIDSFSTDNTKDICLSMEINFFQHPFEGHIQQKNFALEKASHIYVLSLDADEALSKRLRSSLLEIKKAPKHNAYSFNRLTSYCGKWIKHCGWYPDSKIRFWNKTKGNWGGVNPHDKVEMKEGIFSQHIKGDLLHYSFPTISSHVKTAESFSNIAAQEAFVKGKNVSVIYHIILNPVFTFFSKYFLKMGILDGYYGFVICVLSAFSNFLKYTKIRELNKKNVQ